MLHKAFQMLAFYAVLLWLGVMLLLGNAVAALLLFLPKELGKTIGRAIIGWIFRTFLTGCERLGLMQLDLGALEVLNTKRDLIIAPNHPSMLDVFLVVSRIPSAVCLMKSNLRSNPFLGPGAHLSGYICNDAMSSMVRLASKELQQGGKLLIFPEGTRTLLPPINPLKGGVALIAKHSGAPIQTIFICTNSAYLGKGWPIWKPPVFPLIYRATLGERMLSGKSPAATVQLLRSYFEQALPQEQAHFNEVYGAPSIR